MKIIDPKELPKEGTTSEKEKYISHIRSFQGSDHYETIIGIVQKHLNSSIVQELLEKKSGDVNESEIGRLTLVEWAAKSKIKSIKDELTKKYE